MNARQPFESTTATAADAADRAQQTLGSIAVELPGATAIFRKLKLDFCCHGNISLRQAAGDKNLDLAEILEQLAKLERPDVPTEEISPSALIDHILTRYHDVHRAQLPELIRMALRVETVHKNTPHVPTGLADLLQVMQQELLDHMMKEEQVLFPMLKSGGNPFVTQPISMMRAEHIHHGGMLERLNALTNDATPPAGACNTWRALYSGIAQLNEDLIKHIHLENNVLFPAFEASALAARPTGGCGGGGHGCSCQ